MTDELVSALLVGTYGNSILYTLEVLAVIRYYSTSKHNHDSGLFQAMIYFTFLLDTVCTISTYACVYLVCKSSSSFRSNLMNLYFIYSTPSLIGVWFFIASFSWLVSMFRLRYRRCQLPSKAILAIYRLEHNNRYFCGDCAVFLNLSVLEVVSPLFSPRDPLFKPYSVSFIGPQTNTSQLC
jgi:hypothetical protein